MHIKKSLLVFTLMTLTACGTTAIMKEDAKDPTGNESILILGVQSPGYRIQFFPGELTDKYFDQSSIGIAVVNGFPKDGYLVARVQAG